ncbi:MAG: TolC family protein [Chitinophagaceae bacterium]|nr:TolC family protein [Chitinophagaceae bacterium]
MKRYFIILIMLATGISASSQRLTLQEAINIALKNSLDLQLQQNNLEIAKINNHIGVAGGLPVVTANVVDNEQVTSVNQKLNTGTVIQRKAAVGNNLSANVTGSILLYNGSRVIATKNRLDQLETQSEQFLNAQVQNLMAGVMTGYYDVIRQQTYIKTIDQSIGVAQKQLDIVKAQQNVGMANNADLFQSQLDLNALLQTRQSQLLIVDQAHTDLLLLLNLRPDSLIVISDTIIVDRSITLGTILSDIGKNAEVMAAEDQVRINEFIVKEVGAQRYPSIRANAGYNFNRNQTSAGNVLFNQSSGPVAGISLGIPIYNGSIFKRQKKVAEINVRNATIQKDILIRNFTAGAVRTYLSYSSTLQQLATQQENVILAQKLLDLVLLRFELRQATIVEVRQAQQSFENASFTLTNLSFATKSAEIELYRLINQLR